MIGTPITSPGSAPTPERGIRILPIQLQPSSALLDRLSAEISSGKVRIPVELQVPLAEAPQAIEQAREGMTRGKTVINI